MKIPTFAPPLLALALVGGWILMQQSSISALEKESAALAGRVTERKSVPAPDTATGGSADTGVAELKRLAKRLDAVGSEEPGRSREVVRIQRRIAEMSAGEIAAALDELAVTGAGLEPLESDLFSALAVKDPEAVLARYSPDTEGDRAARVALARLAEKDPGAAVAWIDAKISSGVFDSKMLDGRNPLRGGFEAALLGPLLASDPAAAAARLAALPEDHRYDVLMMADVKENEQAAAASLLRGQLPTKEQQLMALSRLADNPLSEDGGGLDKVSAFFDRIQATAEERRACVGRVALQAVTKISSERPTTRKDIDTVRGWLSIQAPERTDNLTGQMLVRAAMGSRTLTFAEASAMAVEYHEASGNDDVLIGFLETGDVLDVKNEARPLAEKIADPERRKEIEKLLK